MVLILRPSRSIGPVQLGPSQLAPKRDQQFDQRGLQSNRYILPGSQFDPDQTWVLKTEFLFLFFFSNLGLKLESQSLHKVGKAINTHGSLVYCFFLTYLLYFINKKINSIYLNLEPYLSLQCVHSIRPNLFLY